MGETTPLVCPYCGMAKPNLRQAHTWEECRDRVWDRMMDGKALLERVALLAAQAEGWQDRSLYDDVVAYLHKLRHIG